MLVAATNMILGEVTSPLQIGFMSTNTNSVTDAAPQVLAEAATLQKRIRIWIAAFVIGLVLSGVTAFPLPWEVSLLAGALRWAPIAEISASIGLTAWIDRVLAALLENEARFPFMAYGTDWLAFAHLVIAGAFWGPWRDPVRNRWVIEWGVLACAGVVPLALICGPLRGIPLGWRIIDCCFGLFGVLPLLIVRRDILRLEALGEEITSHQSERARAAF
jgi:hypothetical protein